MLAASPPAAKPPRSRSASRSSTTSASTRPAPAWCRCSCSTARPSPSARARASSSTNSSTTRRAAKARWWRASPRARCDFVGGKLSKNDPGVKIKTPAGALTVRGGIALIKVNGPNRAAARSASSANFSRFSAAAVTRQLKPGSMFVVSGPGPATGSRPATAADINSLLAAVSGQKTKLAGKTGEGAEMALLLRHPADRHLPGSALHQGTGITTAPPPACSSTA